MPDWSKSNENFLDAIQTGKNVVKISVNCQNGRNLVKISMMPECSQLSENFCDAGLVQFYWKFLWLIEISDFHFLCLWSAQSLWQMDLKRVELQNFWMKHGIQI